ncbi:uncharacterized protein NMK_1294 [Novimethylophilus kurashikiensis]|uniref:Zinc-ribbon domain-containing protein n=1 Tax=Novimethylophilus kurashikiensis TaxID=1825523 RepID=A0A2R5F9Z7_9PROT|nr:zinc ribbon domain-containing protein [Novimethylophilus kurashikiensis]GBG13743.1 uncharacterized protein NMK_1294 [Novimethylophilus kurashikiensis]
MHCATCGTDSEDSARFCSQCGTPLVAETASQHKASSSSTPHPSSDSPPRSNPFSDFYAAQPEPETLRRSLVIGLSLLLAGAFALTVALYRHHKTGEIAELAKVTIPPANKTASTTPQDEIAACPEGIRYCVGGNGSVKDPSCSPAQPFWAHYSTDGGKTWQRAGCFSDEAQAKAGLQQALGISVPEISGPMVNTAPGKTAEQESSAKVTSLPAKSRKTQPGTTATAYHAKFKGPFGIVLEERNYSSAEMRDRAEQLWQHEHKLLEPDGSINTRYVTPKPKTGLIPGH